MAMELDCPKCLFTPLAEKTEKGLVLDACPKCGGCWFDLGELGGAVQGGQKLEKALADGPLRPREGSAVCPRCHGAMINGGLVNELLRVDLCMKCRGLWLDKNEVGLLQRLLDAP